ncbi:phosphotyrosine-specific ptp2-like protein [Sporothrix epigloea]|uniref:protein-tyrosine-phosphatase n=1 Tax=Sporothrix epigloea TaxID=1892477 RepID=A0ABP0DNL3_9PEZI
MMPLDANPAFEAFRKGAEANHFMRSFSLSSHLGGEQTSPNPTPASASSPSESIPLSRPQVTRRSTQENNATSHPVLVPPGASSAMPFVRPVFPNRCSTELHHKLPGSSKMETDVDADSLHDSAHVSLDSNRNHGALLELPVFPDEPRFESPVQLDPKLQMKPPAQQLSAADVHRQAPTNFSLNLGRLSMIAAKKGSLGAGPTPLRSESLPESSKLEKDMIDARHLKEIMDLDTTSPSSPAKRLLLLDVRVATYYAASRIRGALNMCIPTTLLKRATFTLQKMQLTFAKDEDQASFSSWRDASYLVVYDNNSAEKRDAIAATNLLRKFTNDGYKGQAFILRGGFKAFQEAYPDLIDSGNSSSPPSGMPALSLNSSAGPRRPSIAPILGGVMLPCATTNTNPFFSNIRQNMDLADGVGRMELALPQGTTIASLPDWLREAADPADHGQKVSKKFLQIELAEQSRMRDAYGVVRASVNSSDPCAYAPVTISGVEKGGKNRYKDILPFDHARVRLQGRAAGDCDYVNASHLRASRSHKRYIASQAPLPATCSDFWSMIWDEDVRVIVMLTAESEGGQVKCHPYWKNNEYGSLTLRLLSEKKVSLEVDKYGAAYPLSGPAFGSTPALTTSATSAGDPRSAPETGRRRAHTLVNSVGSNVKGPAPSESFFGPCSSSSETPFVYIRKFALSHRGRAFAPIREVTQLHYPSWPDFGTPAKPSHLLALVELANAIQRATSPATFPPPTTTKAMARSRGASGSTVAGHPNIFWPLNEMPEANPTPRPMLVHCSAGCGRTGAFCTVDSVVDMLKRQRQRCFQRADAATGLFQAQDEDSVMTDNGTGSSSSHGFSWKNSTENADKSIDTTWLDSDQVDLVARTVEDFRTQRLSMVQSLRQYVLCYEAVAEWLSKAQDRHGGATRGPGRARSESLHMTM